MCCVLGCCLGLDCRLIGQVCCVVCLGCGCFTYLLLVLWRLLFGLVCCLELVFWVVWLLVLFGCFVAVVGLDCMLVVDCGFLALICVVLVNSVVCCFV